MIPPTCRAVFIIHAKYLVHNIIVNATRNGDDSKQVNAKQLFHRVKQNMKMLKFTLYPFIFCSFSVGYLVKHNIKCLNHI